ncbi:MAG: Gfo/Idh/MocA family protein [Desulforhopalus sp.]
MEGNPVFSMLGRPLRLAVIGGGPGSFIGGMHRLAARLDNRYQLVAGVLSSDPDRSVMQGREIGLEENRAYSAVDQMLEKEAKMTRGAEVIAVMTPNDSHFEYSMAALEHGLDVICDKPMTNSVEDAHTLHAKVVQQKRIFCLTHNYTGYPMTRQARAMVADGELGTVRMVQVEYVQGGKADESVATPSSGPRSWRFDPSKGGTSLVMGDIGTHAHNLARFITGLEITELCAERGSVVPGRAFDDFAGALLRFENGARGSFWVTQAAAGVENSLKIRVSGTKGSLEWFQEIPQQLTYKPLGAPAQVRTPNGPGILPLAARASRIGAGHPEGFPEGFANLYSDAAEAIAAKLCDDVPDPLALHFPTSEDGLAGALFVDAVIRSSDNNSSWEKVFAD